MLSGCPVSWTETSNNVLRVQTMAIERLVAIVLEYHQPNGEHAVGELQNLLVHLYLGCISHQYANHITKEEPARKKEAASGT